MVERMGGGFQKIPPPFIRPKAEGERKKGKFDRPLDVISADFLSDFNRQSIDLIKRGEYGLLAQNFSAAVFKIVATAEKEKDKEFAADLEKYILDDSNYWFIVPGSNDASVKSKARGEMIEDLKKKGVSEEEISRFEFEEELEQEKSTH